MSCLVSKKPKPTGTKKTSSEYVCTKSVITTDVFISNQCSLDVSVISRKPEVNPKTFTGKNTFKKATLQILNFIPVKLGIH